jgi:hypothetical protein
MHGLTQKGTCSFVTYYTYRSNALCERSTIRSYVKLKLCDDNDKMQG